jgi:hypothetical protein
MESAKARSSSDSGTPEACNAVSIQLAGGAIDGDRVGREHRSAASSGVFDTKM